MKPPIFALNIPNIITVLRILLTPLFVILLQKNMFLMAFIVFAIAGISDGLDGFIARYYNQRTVMGAYLDPIADKLLLMVAYLSLALLELLPQWLTVIVISRDVMIVLGIAIFSIANISFEIKPSIISKFTTFSQITTIFLTLLAPAFSSTVFSIQIVFFWATAALTTMSGLHYLYIGLNILQNALGNSHSP